MNFFPFAQIRDISPRPVLFVVGEKAHSRYFSEDAYRDMSSYTDYRDNKELLIVPGAGHGLSYLVDRQAYLAALTAFQQTVLTKRSIVS